MRHEPAALGGDRRGVLADADAGGFVADDPRADRGVVAVKFRQFGARLLDEAFAAIRTARAVLTVFPGKRYVCAFALKKRFRDKTRIEVLRSEISRQQVGVSGKQFP